MSFRVKIDRFLGLMRSLLMYYAIPGRGRAWKRYYADWLNEDSLAFDIGAHVGNRTSAMAASGARVVAVEASPRMADVLNALNGRRERITILQKAVAAQAGEIKLFSSRRHPTVSTVSSAWKNKMGMSSGFAAVQWDEEELVEALTLDGLIAQFGKPDYCKIDVEGNEWEALKGLSTAIDVLSFEYIPAAKEIALGCISRMESLGKYQFNYFADERPIYAADEWLSGKQMARYLEDLDENSRAGEIIAQLHT
jgi:FkbM family methyltransferase